MVVPVTEARSSAVRPRATGTPAARCHGAHLMSYRHLQSDLQQADRGPVPAPRRPQPEGGAWASSQEQPPAWGAGPPRCGPPAGVRTFRRCRSPGPTPAQRAGSARSASVRAEETGRGEERGRGRGADGGGSWGSCHVTHRSPGSLTAPPAVAGAFGGGGSSGDLVSWSPGLGLSPRLLMWGSWGDPEQTQAWGWTARRQAEGSWHVQARRCRMLILGAVRA
ncbi:translation initiation factor IF-2-like isoform X4 [Lemur catta]|uniref:translation initiation factor IF-2-like isoform X4 n=1 Tax=Lemur catta TaxID=9447 RepID=UPI001E26AD2C|nr:translation initiation factor IF-2-like isoform X4 [Lemur catta]